MLVKLITAADSVLELTNFQTPEEFLALDDMSLVSMVRDINPNESDDAREAATMMNLLDSRTLYKSVFEKVLHTGDKFVSKVFTKPKVRQSIEEEIASIAGIENYEVIVDVPTLPSVPYNPHQIDPMEIAIFETIDGKKVPHNLSDYSNIAEMMKGYMDVIRVYTFDKHRSKVGKAAREVFQEVPDTALIHM